MTDLKIDAEFKALIPPLTSDEFQQLEENVLRDGIQDPLKVWQGTLIDGHNRYEIAQRHGLNFTTTELQFGSRDDVIVWIIKNQFGRRNLSAYDRSLLALKLKPFIAAKAKERQLATQNNNTAKKLRETKEAVPQISVEQSETLIECSSFLKDKCEEVVLPKQTRETNHQVAQMAGVSRDTIAKVEKIEQAATPEIKAALKTGELSINAAYKDIKRKEKEEKAQERLERKQYELTAEMPADTYKLFQADIQDGLADIADNSVDFIITDPPYPKEYISLYGALSQVAARVLKEGGSLVCMCGQSYLPEVINELTKHLNYHWCMCYLTPGGQSPQLFQKRTNTFWKPLIWLVKGKYTGDWIGDTFKSPVNDNDKRFHEWGQSIGGMLDIVKRFTDPNQIILDPFVGGGTTGVTAVISGRKFIGSDIEESNLITTENRIKEAWQSVTRGTHGLA